MKKLYYFLALIGFIACSTESVDIYEGDLTDRDDSNIATIAFDTEVDSSLADQFVKYFGENYAERDGLEVTLTGKMSKEDFSAIKAVVKLDMSDVTLVDGTLPTGAFANAALTKLTLPQTGSLLYIEDGALQGTELTSVVFESSLTTIGDNIFDEDNSSLTSITFSCNDASAIPTITDASLPTRFTKAYGGTSETVTTGGVSVAGSSTVTDQGDVYVVENTLYIYKQDSVWSLYNLSEIDPETSGGFRTVTVYVESEAAVGIIPAVPDLENEIIDLVGDEYAEMDSLDLVIIGTLIAEDFDIFVDARFSSVDFSQATVVGDVMVQEITGTMEDDLVWWGDAIPNFAFNDNDYLLSVVLSPAFEAIGQSAFLSCGNLTSVAYPAGTTEDDIKLMHLAGTSFSQCTSLVDISFFNDAPLITIAAYAFGGCTSIEGISIPESVDSLGIYIINASDVCEYVALEWETADRIPEIYSKTPPFPSQFQFGRDYYITIPDGTRELYEATEWSMYNLKEMSEIRESMVWVELFSDDFSGRTSSNVNGGIDEKDARYLAFESGFTHYNEEQYFVDTNAEIVDDKLVITAKAEQILNKDYIEGSSGIWVSLKDTADYTSSWVSTPNFDFKYGRVEVSAKIPSVYGVAPTVATVGVSDEEWPLCGQANIVTNYADTYVASLIWCGANQSTNTYSDYVVKYSLGYVSFDDDTEKDTFGDDFHTWVMYWTSDQTDIYLLEDEMNDFGYYDSTLVATYDHAYTTNQAGDTTNPFTANYHALAYGITLGNKAGTIDTDMLPVTMEIDYIKVTQEQWQYVSSK